MISIAFQKNIALASLSRPAVLKPGGNVKVRIAITPVPAEVTILQLALGTDATDPQPLAFVEDFTEAAPGIYEALLDAGDLRLMAFMADKGVARVNAELITVIDGLRTVSPNLPVDLQKRIVSGPVTSQSGPHYNTEGEVDAKIAAAIAPLFVDLPVATTELRTEVTPVDMTWERIGTARPFNVIDEGHLHFESAWESGCVGPFFSPNDGQSRLLNELIEVEDGRAKIVGTGVIGSNVHPRAPWVSCQAVIASIAAGGALGPALVKDADHYVAAQYDAAAETIVLTENKAGVPRSASCAIEVTFPLTLTVKIMGSTATAWIGNRVVAVLTTQYLDYRDPATWDGYRYGLVSTGGDHVVAKLRGGPAGILGAENILLVTRADGSPYLLGNKAVMTADCSGVGMLEDWNTCIWLVDLDTAAVEVIGRIYFTQAFDGVVRHAGGNFVRLQWHPDRGEWLLTVLGFDGWAKLGPTPPRGFDSYAWCDIDLHGENFITHDQLTPLGFDGVGFGFGANVWPVGSDWHALCSITAGAGDYHDPVAYGAIRPSYYIGDSLDDLRLVFRDTAINQQMECGTRCRWQGRDYFHWSGLAPNPFPVYDAAGNRLGNLRNIGRYGDTPGIDSGESWAEWICRPRPDGRTEFYAVGNTKEVFTAAGVVNQDGAYDIEQFDQDRGSLALWRAHQTSAGREFPVWQNGVPIRAASVFADPEETTLATGLRFAFPLTADGRDLSPFARRLRAVGTVTHSAPHGAAIGSASGLYLSELLSGPIEDWTTSIVIKLSGLSLDGSIIIPMQQCNLRIIGNVPRFTALVGEAYENVIADTAIADLAAHHILMRMSAGIVSLWLDGVQVGEAEMALESLPGYITAGGQYVGYTGYPSTGYFDQSFSGSLRAAKLWVRALTDAEIAADYNEGDPWLPQ